MPTFYTRGGDQGYTDLLGERVLKSDSRTDAIGTLDEASAQIGFARSLAGAERSNEVAVEAQRDLYVMMAELAFTAGVTQDRWKITGDHVLKLEEFADALADELEIPPHFIVPGDSRSGAAFDVARTVVRRAERQAVSLVQEELLSNLEVVRYLNRLSSVLFLLARFEDDAAGVTPMPAKE